MSGEHPVDLGGLIDALYAAYNAGDAARASALYAPGGRHVEIATGSERTGREPIADGLGGLLIGFPDAVWRERARLVDGCRAAVAYELTGTLQGRLGPFVPAGQRLALRGLHLLRAGVDGIEALEDYWDAATFGRQMGSS